MTEYLIESKWIFCLTMKQVTSQNLLLIFKLVWSVHKQNKYEQSKTAIINVDELNRNLFLSIYD